MKFYPNPIIIANQINFCKNLKNQQIKYFFNKIFSINSLKILKNRKE